MRFIFSAMLLLSLTVLIACQDAAAPTSIKPVASITPQTVFTPDQSDHEHSDDEAAPRITLADAKKAFDAGNAIFVDTRYADAFETERVKGAINIPANEFEAKYNKIPKGKMIIAYCS